MGCDVVEKHAGKDTKIYENMAMHLFLFTHIRMLYTRARLYIFDSLHRYHNSVSCSNNSVSYGNNS